MLLANILAKALRPSDESFTYILRNEMGLKLALWELLLILVSHLKFDHLKAPFRHDLWDSFRLILKVYLKFP